MEYESMLASFSIVLPLLICVFILVFYAAIWIAIEYPYYRMAKRQGVPNAWLAFIPWGNFYITLKLSPREFNLFNIFRYESRSQAFVFFIIVNVAYIALILPMTFLAMIPIWGWLLYFAYIMAYLVLSYGIIWRMYYDVLMTYGMQEHAMWVSIVSVFFPILMHIFAYVIMNREPDMYA